MNKLFYITLLLFVSSLQASNDFAEEFKEKADSTIKNIFDRQDKTASRNPNTSKLKLLRRSLNKRQGISPYLMNQTADKDTLVIAEFDDYPSTVDWQKWDAQKIISVGYLGNMFWLLNIRSDINTAYIYSQAKSFSEFLPQDKIAKELDNYVAHQEFYDFNDDLVVLNLSLINSNSRFIEQFKQTFHYLGKDFIDNSSDKQLTVVTSPNNIPVIAEYGHVISVMPGLWKEEVLMKGNRITAHANNVVGINNHSYLTGEGVRMANNERIFGGVHEDFWTHDSSGNPIQGRWTSLAQSSCINGGSSHGVMTAGIMLGNGWHSETNHVEPLEFRGIAPDATFECYLQAGAKAHLSSHSYVRSGGLTYYNNVPDKEVQGLSSEQRHHAQTTAAGNSGYQPGPGSSTEQGYFSVVNGFKNPMIVANAQVNGQIHPSSSSGPTFDGRIKPDIAAPTGNWVGNTNHALEIESIVLKRFGFIIYSWTFQGPQTTWHKGWGQPDNDSFGQLHLNISQNSQDNMQVDIDPSPWTGTGWSRSPVLGTRFEPYDHPSIDPSPGVEPLDFIGHANDVLEVRYKSLRNDVEYFDFVPTWFRVFPPTDSASWWSQGYRPIVGIGDGQWHTASIPIGQAVSHVVDNPYWINDYHTWQDQNIQFLGFRFSQLKKQSAPSDGIQFYRKSGGTSGASPVVAGGYALAMQHLSELSPYTDIDDKIRPSVYTLENREPYGMPLNSTWKSIFIHTATDMIKYPTPAIVNIPPNPDTGVPTSYHKGPDYTSGYGMINVQSAVDLMTLQVKGQKHYKIAENNLQRGQYHTYKFKVTAAELSRKFGIKATVVWDDAEALNVVDPTVLKLANNLGMFLKDPQGNIHYPWSLDLPYDIYELGNGPHEVEPEPISDADITPARNDLPNDRDNVEQVLVEMINQEYQVGIWTLYIVDNGMASSESQKYSLVISPWFTPKQCHDCVGL